MTAPETIPSIEELKAKRKEFLDGAAAMASLIEKRCEAEKEGRIAESKAFIAKHGLTQADLFGSTVMETTAAVKSARRARATSDPLVPKFLNTATTESWTGMGRNPDWMVNAVKAGKKQEDFLNPKWAELHGPIKVKNKPAKSIAPEQAVV